MISRERMEAGPGFFTLFVGIFFFTFPAFCFYGSYYQYSVLHSESGFLSLIGIGLVLCFLFFLVLCNEYLLMTVTKEFIEVKRPLYNFIGLKKKAYSRFETDKIKQLVIKRLVFAKSQQICRIISTGNNELMKFKFEPSDPFFLKELETFLSENHIPIKIIYE
jgi:hypothetical protein